MTPVRRPSQSPSISLLLNDHDEGHDTDSSHDPSSSSNRLDNYFSVEPTEPGSGSDSLDPDGQQQQHPPHPQHQVESAGGPSPRTEAYSHRKRPRVDSYDANPSATFATHHPSGLGQRSHTPTASGASSTAVAPMRPPSSTRPASSMTPTTPHLSRSPSLTSSSQLYAAPSPPRSRSASISSATSNSRPTSSSGLATAPAFGTIAAPAPIPPPAPVPKPKPPPPPPPPQNTLEPSIFNVKPIDEFTREVADWLWGFCQGLDWNVVEIEAKVGLLVDVRYKNQTRFSLPTPIEHIIMDDSNTRFVSNMTLNQHKSYNVLLNSRVEESASEGCLTSPVRYVHTRETDSFHNSPHGGGGKVRVTTQGKGPEGKVLRVVEKTRLADMNIASPKRCFDWRISVSTELPGEFLLSLFRKKKKTPTSFADLLPSRPATLPPNSSPNAHLTRFKDRMTYTHQGFQIDLTQVSQPNRPILHELEVEFVDVKKLLVEKEKELEGGESRYLDMVQAFLNNIRMLIRNAGDP
ncbi:BZ3500_MvSof-1268-A1-R1_Chr1-3g01691 [Microbotryum saponariae]|uniref:mRNA-capping enzyme subunit beta n=1 Tax=Microbotryum saponariae TaxID=289078 RepID=A0A2X0KL77_9BASI|nr:BZ3500_MvSof-1268-A1-R1_Chr1-3g01691 [Microbotryum saponariae]SCZ94329.1 BZ3501_MvSof-1269-A2-R1_Chr1-3g01292 [Microbotryum saponariae]